MAKNPKVLGFLLAFLCLEVAQSHNPDHYGKPCSKDRYPSGTLVQCDLDHNMHCSEKGICECLVGENGRVFAYHEKQCIELASSENDFSCTENIQCKLSIYGKLSRCNRDYDKCECFDEEGGNTTKVDNICYLQRPIFGPRTTNTFQGCFKDADCQESSLGVNSRCNKASTSCECYDWSSWDREVSFYNGTCVYKKDLRQLCTSTSECRAGFHKNAVCASHPAYLPKEKICQCPEGVNCDGAGTVKTQSLIMIGVTTVIMGILATKVLS